PRLAKHMDQMALGRSMSTKEGDHTRATHYLRTGYLPQGPIQYPPLPALASKELRDESAALPNSVSIAPYRFFAPAAYGTGFLGPKYAPLVVGETASYNGTGASGTKYDQSLKVKNLDLPAEVTPKQRDARVEL